MSSPDLLFWTDELATVPSVSLLGLCLMFSFCLPPSGFLGEQAGYESTRLLSAESRSGGVHRGALAEGAASQSAGQVGVSHYYSPEQNAWGVLVAQSIERNR